MANWQTKIDIIKEWNAYDDGTVTIAEVAKAIVEQLKLAPDTGIDHIDSAKQSLIIDFEEIAESEDEDLENFNYYMNNLYDWGDTSIDGKWNGKKVAWIATNF